MKVRIFEIDSEHLTYGEDWKSYRVVASTAEQAIARAKKLMCSRERVTSVKILASTD